MTDAKNGLTVKTWSDVVAVATLLALFIGVLAWGLKLESELNAVRDDVTNVRGQVGNGILPRAEERIRELKRRVDELEKEAN